MFLGVLESRSWWHTLQVMTCGWFCRRSLYLKKQPPECYETFMCIASCSIYRECRSRGGSSFFLYLKPLIELWWNVFCTLRYSESALWWHTYALFLVFLSRYANKGHIFGAHITSLHEQMSGSILFITICGNIIIFYFLGIISFLIKCERVSKRQTTQACIQSKLWQRHSHYKA